MIRCCCLVLLIAAPAAVFAAPATVFAAGEVFIPDTLGVRRGGNLFHSFPDFNIGAGGRTTFTQTQSGTISSIFARVTGNTRSQIDGTLRSTISGASLYLLNSNGITFGPGARLDLKGSFSVSTADYLTFSDGITFSKTTPLTEGSLSAKALSSFGFLGNAPKSIEISSTCFEVNNGANFTAIGGDISVKIGTAAQNGGSTPGPATIRTHGGNATLTSVAAKGDVALNGRLAATGPRRRGAAGIVFAQAALDTSSTQGGGITIRAPKLTLSQSDITSTTSGAGSGGILQLNITGKLAILSDDSSIATNTSGRGTAGAVNVHATSAHITKGFLGSRATSEAEKGAAAGHVRITAGQLSIVGGGSISASTEGAGSAGAVNVTVANGLRMNGTGSTIVADTLATKGGRGGNVRVSAGEIALTNGARIGSSTTGDGRGGDVAVSAKTISIERGSRIEASTAGRGQGGSVAVNAYTLSLNGGNDSRGTGIFANNDSTDRRTVGGNISVQADELSIRDGSLITTRLTGPGRAGNVDVVARDVFISRGVSEFFTGIAADTALSTSGFGGNVRVHADRIAVADGGQISSFTAGVGKGGDVSVTADELTITGGKLAAVIGTESQFTGFGGDGGKVSIDAGKLTILTGGRVSASTFGAGAAGDVTVRAGSVFISQGTSTKGTGILSESLSADLPGAGGNVRIDADSLTVLSGGRVSAGTFGPGDGGDVTVAARTAFFSSEGSDLLTGILVASRSTTAAGKGGSVQAKFGDFALHGGRISATTAGPGTGGSVSVETGGIVFEQAGGIEASATGTGAAGSVSVTSDTRIDLRNGSSITVKSAISDAGSIRLIAPDYITLQNSTILAEAGLNGGDVFIDPQFVILDHSSISANAILGAGGNITLIADTFLSSESGVTASSEASVQGTIDIQSPDAQLANALTALPGGLLGIEIRLTDRCPMRLSAELSSFLLIGRGGLPPAPDDLR